MTDLNEAVLAVRAARENTRLEVICTMTFDKLITAEYRTMMGISPSDMVQPLLDAGATILGTNCGNGIAGMVPVVEEIRKCNRDIPILVHANAGIPYYRDGRTVFPEEPGRDGFSCEGADQGRGQHYRGMLRHHAGTHCQD